MHFGKFVLKLTNLTKLNLNDGFTLGPSYFCYEPGCLKIVSAVADAIKKFTPSLGIPYLGV
jgi:hypothetical protein